MYCHSELQRICHRSVLPVGISCCKSSNVYSISSCGKQPRWLVCSRYPSNVFPTNLSKMAVGRDALGKASVKLLRHERSPCMHHVRHAAPLQCREIKNGGKQKERETQGWLANVNTLFTVYSYHATWFICIEVQILQLPIAVIWNHRCRQQPHNVGYINFAPAKQHAQSGWGMTTAPCDTDQVSGVLCWLSVTLGYVWCAVLCVSIHHKCHSKDYLKAVFVVCGLPKARNALNKSRNNAVSALVVKATGVSNQFNHPLFLQRALISGFFHCKMSHLTCLKNLSNKKLNKNKSKGSISRLFVICF